ncbi:MAG TPA: hypothetical protein VEK79_15815 [Thermoanaerobaculia bacterium]|nr:hypothetical protein [Thermoanaerobaculia bacterium]
MRHVLLASLILLSTAAAAQQAYDPATEPRVVGAQGSWQDGSAGLGDRLEVKVKNFPSLLQKVSGNCHAIVLYLDGLPLRGMPPESCNQYDGTVRYLLDRDPEHNDAEWHRLLGSPNSFTRKTRVSVGADDQFAFPTDKHDFKLKVIPGPWFYTFLALLALFGALFIHLCRTTTMIRAPQHPSLPGPRPYSLARFQMAFWFFLVIAGYVFMWMITGELDTITDSVLALLGIGAGTALGAALIDSQPAGTATITSTTTSATTDTTATVTTPVPSAPPEPSQGFLRDVLSDASDGISIHRFQMFAWTLILGVIFVASVYKDLGMPEFNVTLLGLMGISSGTYLGFKIPEKKQADQR